MTGSGLVNDPLAAALGLSALGLALAQLVALVAATSALRARLEAVLETMRMVSATQQALAATSAGQGERLASLEARALTITIPPRSDAPC